MLDGVPAPAHSVLRTEICSMHHEIFVFYTILVIVGPLLAHFGPPFDPPRPPGRAKMRGGGTGQNAPKTGVNHPKMRFGAILDHMKVTLIHFGPF